MTHNRISIRTLRQSDLGDIHEIMLMPQVLWGTSLLPTTSIDARRKMLENWITDEHVHIFVSEINQKVVGLIRLKVGAGRQSHSGTVEIMIHDTFHNQGIGKMLMLTIIDLADSWLNLLKLECIIFTDNERALSLFKRFDFEVEGTSKSATFRGGTYIDSYLLARFRPVRSPRAAQTQVTIPKENTDSKAEASGASEKA